MGYSPILAIVTGGLEIVAAAWVFSGLSRGRKRILRPVGTILLLLAGYQFAEVLVCGRPGLKLWSVLAYLDITWLPPLGLWLTARLSGFASVPARAAAWVETVLALGFSVWILAHPDVISRSVCELVVAKYYPTAPFDISYGAFYQAGLAGIIFGTAYGMGKTRDMVLRKHLALLQAGVLGFVLPAFAIGLMAPEEPGSLMPSVMCHLAIVLAGALFVIVLRERRAHAGGAPSVAAA